MAVFIYIVSGFFPVDIISQDATVPDNLPTADASALGKKEKFSTSLFSGKANIGIPLYSLEANNRTLNVSLSYDASGVNARNHPGWVGQNWSLEAGGIITRSVKGLPDEYGMTNGSQYSNYNVSYIDVVQDGSFVNPTNTSTVQNLQNLGLNVLQNGYALDFSADIFNFSFLGYSGSFFLDWDGQWKVISNDNIKVDFDIYGGDHYTVPFIENMPNTNNTKKYQHVIKGFTLIDAEGYRYTFGIYDAAGTSSPTGHNAVDYSLPFFHQYSYVPNLFPYVNEWTATAWHLTKVEDYNYNVIFELNYERDYFTAQIYNTLRVYETFCIDPQGTHHNSGSQLTQNYDQTPQGVLQSNGYLSAITTIHGEHFSFKRSNAEQKSFEWLDRFADYTQFEYCPYVDCGNNYPYPFLQYPGYYSFDPMGSWTNPFNGLKWKKLDSIIYCKNYAYINCNVVNSVRLEYNNVSTERLKLISVHLTNDEILTNPNAEHYSYTIDYENFSGLPEYLTREFDHFGYYDGSPDFRPTYLSDVYNFPLWEANYYPSRTSNYNYAKIGQIKALHLPTGGRIEYDFELHSYNSVMSDNRQSIINETGSIGGLRIKEMRTYDANSTNYAERKRYKYVENYQNNGQISSGILGFKPKYVWTQWNMNTAWSSSGYGYYESIVSENNLAELTNLFEPPVTYKEVAVVNEDNSYEIFKFISQEELKDQLPYTTLIPGVSPYMDFTEMGFYRGHLKEHKFYSDANDLVKQIVNVYDIADVLSSNQYGISTDPSVAYVCTPLNLNYAFYGSARKVYFKKLKLNSSTISDYFGGNPFTTQHNYEYVTYPIDGFQWQFNHKSQTNNSAGDNYSTTKYYSFDHTSSYGGQQPYLYSLENDYRLVEVASRKHVNNQLVGGHEILFNTYGFTNIMPHTVKTYEATWDSSNSLSGTWETQKTIDEYDMKFLQAKKSTISGWAPQFNFYNSRGLLTSTTFLNFAKQYNYNAKDLLLSYNSIDGLSSVYTYDHFGRLKNTSIYPKNVNSFYKYYFPTLPTEKAYFKSKIYYPFASGSAVDSIVNITYLDGLGRAVENIYKYGGSSSSQDVISQTQYDLQGRSYKNFVPIGVDGNNGNYYSGSFDDGFSETLFLSDPLNRPSQTTPPQWNATHYLYGTNNSALTDPQSTVFPAGTLKFITTTDPDNKSTTTYTDKRGRTVLVRVAQGGSTADTWTVYDDKDRPIKVYPPGTSPSTPELIYTTLYDGDDNIIYSKSPDAAPMHYRYSTRNLQTAMQNGVLAAQGKWLVTHYDGYGRPSKRGYFSGSDPGNTETPTIQTLLEEYFYDGFNGSSTNSAPIYKGKLTKSRVKVLEDGGTNPAWVETEYAYDAYGRVQTESITDHLGVSESKAYTYDFADNVLTEPHTLPGTNGVQYYKKYAYDSQGRRINDKINVNTQGEINLAECSYDHKSQLTECNLGRFATTGLHQHLQSLDYTYNAQGWLKSINTLFTGINPYNDPCDPSSNSGYSVSYTDNNTDYYDLFAEVIDYTTTPSGSGVTPSLNGNISTLKWWHAGQDNQTYSYTYDYLNRVTTAKQGLFIQGSYAAQNHYNEAFQYDVRGNITHLDRKGLVHRPNIAEFCYHPVTIDSLVYVYATGTNKLIQVVDHAPCPDVITLPAEIERDITYGASQEIIIDHTAVSPDVSLSLYAPNIQIIDSLILPQGSTTPPVVTAYPGPCPLTKYTEGFNQQSLSGQYTYDAAGNMTYDPNKKLTFYYNHLNLPYKIAGAENDELQLLYASDGTLLQRKYLKNATTLNTIDYLRGVEYVDAMPESVYHDHGRCILSGVYWKPEYHITDHLGNVRATFTDDDGDGFISNTERRSVNDYYTYGMEWNNKWELSDTISPLNRYRYNAKEYIPEMGLNQLLYGARNFDPVLGRWWAPDPMALKIPGWSPYHYTLNNPIRLIDPNGMYFQTPGTSRKQLGWGELSEKDLLEKAESDGIDNEYDRVWNQEKQAYDYVQTSTLGGDVFDVIHTINGTIPQKDVTITSEIFFNEYGGPRISPGVFGKPHSPFMASGQLHTLDGADDPVFNVITLGQGATFARAGASGMEMLSFSAFKYGDDVAVKGATVVGEGMARVEAAASKIPGAKILNDMPKFTGTVDQITSQMMTYNRQWILQQMRSGRPILDIGRDLNRANPSIFYQMEQNMMNNYLKLHPNSFQIIKP
ncbi:MAG: RHS repeat-associated core domain-containing protein [Lewinellaceae bacterium]|nr:RHS repeat-associated core domain-containing protein [Lewinellaceae bacterium]